MNSEPLNIGFLLPPIYSFDGKGNGVRAFANNLAKALTSLGQNVKLLSGWDSVHENGGFHVVHYFQGGPAFSGIHKVKKIDSRIIVFSPVIDSNQSNLLYLLASKLGNITNRVMTIPGEYRKQAMAADLVIVMSSHERDRVIAGLGVSRDKVKIVLGGASIPSTNQNDTSDVLSKYNLPKRFLLHVSIYTQARKNVMNLISAALNLDMPIVIAGTHDADSTYDKIITLRNKHSNKVFILPFVSSQELASLYQACDTFCLPSLHEGIGLAALEAGANGAKVVITQNGGPPDYFKDYAYYVDPKRKKSLERQLRIAWASEKTDALSAHIRSKLTWSHSAQSMLSNYRKILSIKFD